MGDTYLPLLIYWSVFQIKTKEVNLKERKKLRIALKRNHAVHTDSRNFCVVNSFGLLVQGKDGPLEASQDGLLHQSQPQDPQAAGPTLDKQMNWKWREEDQQSCTLEPREPLGPS